jgi:hypothetical protein
MSLWALLRSLRPIDAEIKAKLSQGGFRRAKLDLREQLSAYGTCDTQQSAA